MPQKTSVSLQLPPGEHVLRRYVVGVEFGRLGIASVDLKVRVDTGKTHYVAIKQSLLQGLSLEAIGDKEGAELVRFSDHAKIIHAPATTIAFEEKLRKAYEKSPDAQNKPSQPNLAAAIGNALPSAETVGEALGLLAVVALAVVMIGAVGLAVGAGGFADAPASPPPAPAAYMQRQSPMDRLPASLTISNGTTVSISPADQARGLGVTEIRNANTGTRYRIEGDRITASDGTRYRVGIGGQVIADTGVSYTAVGNTVTGSDGSKCTRIGDKLYCKP